MVWSHKFEETSTTKIRRTLRIDSAKRGIRVLYITKLVPITKLSGEELLRAWWQVLFIFAIVIVH